MTEFRIMTTHRPVNGRHHRNFASTDSAQAQEYGHPQTKSAVTFLAANR
jgi:hypothetical protein